jgi:hypothetical protein
MKVHQELFDVLFPIYMSEVRLQIYITRNTTASHSGSPGFKIRPGDRLPSLKLFLISLSPSTRMMGYYLKLGYDRFLPNPFQFIIYL